MAAPLLRAEVDIDAPPAEVWKLISDFGRMPEWSPQCRWMKALGPLRPGTRTINLNRRKKLFWPTTCTVTEVIPQKKLAFRVDTNRTEWVYELEPTATGTRVVESRRADRPIPAVPAFLAEHALGGTGNFEQELVEGMNASLARIKAAAERR